MKRSIVLSLASLLTIFSFAQITSNDALYIYRNDGKFNAFFYSEIDSITTSKSDELGNVYDEYKSQVVWTKDSVYWIPLEAIDSVSLCKPQNKYSSGVRKIDELLPYITDVDGMTINLSPTTPSNLIPKNGDVLVYENFEDERFPFGFAGRVGDVESSKIVCDSVSFEDIYEDFVCFGEYQAIDESDDKGNSRRRFVPKKINSIISPSFDISGTYRPDTTKTWVNATLSGHVSMDISLLCKLSKGKTSFIDVSFHPHMDVSVEAGLKGKVHHESNIPIGIFRIPIPYTPFLVMIDPDLALKASAEGSMSFSSRGTFGFECGFKYENEKWSADGHNKLTNEGLSMPTLTGNINGSLYGGIRFGVSLCTIGEIIGIAEDFDAGFESVANFSTDILDLPSTSVYEELKKVNVDINFLASIGLSLDMKFGMKKEMVIGYKLASMKSNLTSRKIVPSFTAPSVDKLESTQIITSVVPKERLLWPITVGLGVCNQDGELLTAKFCDDSYMLPESWPLEKYMESFDGLALGTTYDVCPMIKFMGAEIKASPSTTFITKFPTPAKVKKFEVNNATFIRDGFEYKDKPHYYDFAATTTVELEDSEGVEDWGYVYKDPEGEKIHISVKHLGTNADSRYDYYRTIPKSTATLYGYAKYGEDKYAYEEPKEYPLEYTFHLKAYVGDVIADSITTISAQFEYGFDDVPRTGKCYIAYQAVDEDEPKIEQVSYTEKDTIKVSDLYPATTYNYWAYVEYAGETYMDLNGKKSFTTLTPSAYVKDVISGTITASSAQFEYGFSNVPDDGTCYISIQADGVDEIEAVPVSATDKDTYTASNLQPDTKYSYWAYIEYKGKTYADFNGKKTFTTLAPTATTGESSNITHNSAIVECVFANVPEGGVCGVEYTWNGGSMTKSVNITNGSIAISLSGLKSNTEYTYCAYVEVNGKTYYGADKTFTTLTGIPDLSGTWSCTTYNDDGSVLETATLTLTSDKRATSKTTSGSSFIPETETGSWSISSEGKVGIVFSWTGGSSYHPVWYSASFTGYVSSLSSPSSIEGTVYRAWASTSEHGNVYKFKMTR